MAISVDFGPKAYKFRVSEDYCLAIMKKHFFKFQKRITFFYTRYN